MFPTSTQKKYWSFKGQTELDLLRKETSEAYVKHTNLENKDQQAPCLNATEEKVILRHYEYAMKEFCARFKPPMPSYVVGTSMAYMKRFYLHTSVMDYHPKEIMLTAVYLACKVEEFNVSIQQFVANLKGDRERISEIILGFELLLMHELNYHLTVHNPFRPLEGHLIDLKTQFPELENPEKMRKAAEDFLDKSLNTDACLVFAPSQIALAGLLTSASKNGVNLDSYIKHKLLTSGDQETFTNTVQQIKRIKFMVKNIGPLSRDEVKKLEKKLEKCRNQENNPNSEAYKRKMKEMLEDEEERQTEKRVKYAEHQDKLEKELLGLT